MRVTLYMLIAATLLISVFPVGVRAGAGEPRAAPSFAWYRLIVPFGIATLSLLVLTFIAGWFMRLKRKLLFKWHRRLAIATLVAALCHLLLVILFR